MSNIYQSLEQNKEAQLVSEILRIFIWEISVDNPNPPKFVIHPKEMTKRVNIHYLTQEATEEQVYETMKWLHDYAVLTKSLDKETEELSGYELGRVFLTSSGNSLRTYIGIHRMLYLC